MKTHMPKKILVVDDDTDIVYILKSTLEKNGYEVITARWQQALKLIKTNVPDLMIVDLTMPVMNGWRFNMKVREDERYKTTPIIILSGLLEREISSDKIEDGSPICLSHLIYLS